jgi:hypothetical protein
MSESRNFVSPINGLFFICTRLETLLERQSSPATDFHRWKSNELATFGLFQVFPKEVIGVSPESSTSKIFVPVEKLRWYQTFQTRYKTSEVISLRTHITNNFHPKLSLRIIVVVPTSVRARVPQVKFGGTFGEVPPTFLMFTTDRTKTTTQGVVCYLVWWRIRKHSRGVTEDGALPEEEPTIHSHGEGRTQHDT